MKIIYSGAMRSTTMLFLTAILCFSACKQETNQENKPVASDKTAARTSVQQELPGGKKYFSICIGRFATNSPPAATWVRIVNWTFDSATGTVSSYYWQWDTNQQKGKTAFNSHPDSWSGSPTVTCTTYTPTGWIFPAGQYFSMSGTYTYNPANGALHIAWSDQGAGDSENWTVTNPISTLARVSFVSSAGHGYAITHGAGYGSNRSFGTQEGYHFKKVENIPKVLYSGKRVLYNYTSFATPAADFHPSNAPTGAWEPYSLPLNLSTLASGGTSLHYYTPTGSGPCDNNPRLGAVTHVASNNNSRAMVYNQWLACHAGAGWPCYNGQMHPYAMYQVIDDLGAMKGFIGIEQQDQPGSTCCFQYQLIDYTVVP